MAIVSAICNSFKTECMGGIHDLDTDTLKMALYTSSATLSKDTTAYTATEEISGTGYSTGGITLSGVTIALSTDTAVLDFTDPEWPSASFTARGALIYNSSKANRAIAVIDFGSDKTASGTLFKVVLPTADASNAIIRLA